MSTVGAVGAALGDCVLKASNSVEGLKQGCFTFFDGAPIVVGAARRLTGSVGQVGRALRAGTVGTDCQHLEEGLQQHQQQPHPQQNKQPQPLQKLAPPMSLACTLPCYASADMQHQSCRLDHRCKDFSSGPLWQKGTKGPATTEYTHSAQIPAVTINLQCK